MHKYSEAQALLEEIVIIVAQNLGERHADVGVIYGNLAIVYRCQSNFNASINAHEKAIEIMEDVFGPDHADSVYQRAHMGITQIRMGYPQKGKRLIKDCMASLRNNGMSDDHPWMFNFKSEVI